MREMHSLAADAGHGLSDFVIKQCAVLHGVICPIHAKPWLGIQHAKMRRLSLCTPVNLTTCIFPAKQPMCCAQPAGRMSTHWC